MSGPARAAERIIITVMRPGTGHGHDLEVPTDLPAADLADRIARAMQWTDGTGAASLSYQLEAHPPGLFLHPEQTLAEAGVWDGAWLVLHPRRTAPPRPVPRQQPVQKASPVVGWRPL